MSYVLNLCAWAERDTVAGTVVLCVFCHRKIFTAILWRHVHNPLFSVFGGKTLSFWWRAQGHKFWTVANKSSLVTFKV